MAAKKNRWMTIVVMSTFALFLLVPLIMVPLSQVFRSAPSAANSSPSPSVSPAAAQEQLNQTAAGYEAVLQREPDNQTALKGLVETRLAQGNLKAAIAPIERLLQLNAGDPGVGLLLAKVKERTGDLDGAKQAYRDTLATQPVNVSVLQGFRDFLLQQNQPEAAIGLLQDTVRNAETLNRQTPGSVKTEELVSVQLLLGETYARQERFAEAIGQYDKAIQADNQDFRPLVAKALVLRQQGNEDGAKPLFISAAALAPAQYKDAINQLASSPSPGATPSPGAASPASSAAGGSQDASKSDKPSTDGSPSPVVTPSATSPTAGSPPNLTPNPGANPATVPAPQPAN